MTVTRTYTGPLRSGTVALPARHVRFVAGEAVEFTADEAELLDPAEWTTPKPKPKPKAVQAETPADPAADTEEP